MYNSIHAINTNRKYIITRDMNKKNSNQTILILNGKYGNQLANNINMIIYRLNETEENFIRKSTTVRQLFRSQAELLTLEEATLKCQKKYLTALKSENHSDVNYQIGANVLNFEKQIIQELFIEPVYELK